MAETFAVLLPIIALIVLGHLLRRTGILGPDLWSGIERLVYYLLFPALLFGTLASRPIDLGAGGLMILVGFGFMLGGMLLGLAARSLLAPSPKAFASIFQCGFRFNTYIGLAVLGGIHGSDGIAAFALLAGFVIPLANVASVWALARHSRHAVLPELARNPFILATFGGLGWSASGLPLPDIALSTLLFLGEPALPLGLLATGAALAFTLDGRQKALVAYFVATKLLAVPVLALGLAVTTGLTGVYLAAAVLLAALPPASSAYILAIRMGGDGPLVAATVGAATVVAALTLPMWLHVLGP
jgi:malonate transporter and related proteins